MLTLTASRPRGFHEHRGWGSAIAGKGAGPVAGKEASPVAWEAGPVAWKEVSATSEEGAYPGFTPGG